MAIFASGSSPCSHADAVCINPYELIRKYSCVCGAVMMCACDEVFGKRFLAHQLAEATDLKTRQPIGVTHGFQPNVCAECRGKPALNQPVGAIHGRISKIKRYYWRELFFESIRRNADWNEAHPDATKEEERDAYKCIEADVLAEVKALHKSNPKYTFHDPSQAEILADNNVAIISMGADYVETPSKGAVIRDGENAISPELFVTRHYEAKGWSVLPLESVPLHALFGVMMWMLIQDPLDEHNRMVGFGSRTAFEAGEAQPPVIWTPLPDDFGCEGYGTRREKAIADHLEKLLPEREELLWTFDYWRAYSENFRQYLWAHRSADVDRARRLIEILDPDQILMILHHLASNYWDHYLGWPDLLLYRPNEILLVEVKSSTDKLSQNQMDWIKNNRQHLKLPFAVVKLHRSS